MKGQIRAGNLVIATVVLIFVIFGAFALYANFLVDSGATPDQSMQSEIDSLYASSRSSSYQTLNSSGGVSTQFDSGDNIFIRGSKILDQVTSTTNIAISAVDLAENSSTKAQIPTEFFDTTKIIIFLIVAFVIAGALWRYDFLS